MLLPTPPPMLLPPNTALNLVVAFVAPVSIFAAASDSRVVAAAAITNGFPSKLRAHLYRQWQLPVEPADIPPLPDYIRFSDCSSNLSIGSLQTLALSVAALMSSGVIPRKISASGYNLRQTNNGGSAGDLIVLAAAP